MSEGLSGTMKTSPSEESLMRKEGSDSEYEDATDSSRSNKLLKLTRSHSARSQRPGTAHSISSRRGEKRFRLEESSDSDVSVNEDDMFILKKGKEEFEPVDGELGLYCKRHLNNPVDIYTKKLYSTLPKSNNNPNKTLKAKMTYAEQLEQHTVSVKAPFSEKGRIAERGWKRVSYIGRMFLAELGLSEWASREFWAMLILFVITFFMRIFLHYTGQYLYLLGMKIPVNSFNFLPYTVRLNYQSSLLHVLEEMLIVLIGPMTIFLLFVFFVIVAWLCQKAMGMFPDVGCKFVLMFGIQSFLNPVFVSIVDAAEQRYDYAKLSTSMPLADFAKLYWFFVRTQGSGIGGIFVTVFLYLFVMFISAAVLYMYFLRLHNNGRMLDIYWRLHSQADDLFVPYDLEVSLQELEYVCTKAEQWRGEEGARRKVAVYDYVWEEEDVKYSAFDEVVNTVRSKKKREKTTHIAIHTLHTDGLRELYRHFLVLPDGAIVEVFGEMSYVPGLTKDVKKAINTGAKKLEHLLEFGSSTSLNKAVKTLRSRASTVNSVATASKVKVKAARDGESSTLHTPATGRAVRISVKPELERPSSSGKLHSASSRESARDQ